ncbi:hypothetical protein HID58_066417 [Brassica napus]|uniref:BnaA09g24920D protein n=2 Tax=Brassica napus TaxID=3708 RepID=A0A078FH52_BRANA|nr:F-box protein At2g35280-like [Brassica napus]KAH0879023.1 hypothetical protein HID58_066417 [Brassica napus]CAF1929096.1 unnamed protein product [Brassica napus]CDY12292.1 BnaA09g24920D [Brassica napus]
MEPTNRSLTRLDTMPNGMLRLIISKVGAASSTDYCNTVLTCKSLNFSLDDPLIAKTLNIAPLVERPHLANRYEKTMESILAANNLDAHYVKAKRDHKEAKYLYGVLHMALGMIEKGKKILTKLTEDEGLDSVEMSWENI